jgi:hypothetical protein
MVRRFQNWLYRPAGRRPWYRRRRLTGCLLWVLIAIGILVILSLMFGTFQKGTRVSGASTLIRPFHSAIAPAGPAPPDAAATRYGGAGRPGSAR